MSDPSSDRPFLSILVPAYNEERTIGRLLSSVKEALADAGIGSFEIIVCDNNSRDATGEVALRAGARVIFEPHNQIARARNAAAAASRGEWLVFVDADSRLSRDLLEATLRRIRSGKVGGGGALVRFDREELPRQVRIGLGMWNWISRTFRLAAGSFVFCRREAWEATGGFCEERYAGEELPFSRNLRKWCRARGARFEIITETRLVTSARKIENYTSWQMLRLVARLTVPGAIRSRDRCGYWYTERR